MILRVVENLLEMMLEERKIAAEMIEGLVTRCSVDLYLMLLPPEPELIDCQRQDSLSR